MDFDDLDEAEDDAIAETGPERKLPEWKAVPNSSFDYLEMKERAAMNLPGDYFGINFPHSKEQVLQWGPKWLTEAFHKSGVLTVDNEVTDVSLKDVTDTVSGGAGLKYVVKVKYLTPKEYLHEDLFMKLPHEPKGSDRYYVSVMWGHDRPETVFNIWLSPYVPFKVPKLYFCDICTHTSNFILITEQIKFAPKGTTEFGPGDIEPAYEKYSDWQMPDGGPRYYLAACRNLGKLAAYHKTGRLHPNVNEMFPMPGECHHLPKGLPGMDPDAKKVEMVKVDQFVRFMSETAVTAFPKDITDKKWLEELKAAMGNLMDYSNEIQCYCSGAGTPSPNDYVTLTHNNLQVDNAIYYHNEENELEVGMLDWGVLSCCPFICSIQGGCISGAQPEIYCEHRDSFIRAAMDSYREHGGPELDFERMKLGCDLQVCLWVMGCAKNVSAVLKETKAPEWATITELTDKRVRTKKTWNSWAWSYQFNNALLIWQQLRVYERFQQWLQDEGLPPHK